MTHRGPPAPGTPCQRCTRNDASYDPRSGRWLCPACAPQSSPPAESDRGLPGRQELAEQEVRGPRQPAPAPSAPLAPPQDAHARAHVAEPPRAQTAAARGATSENTYRATPEPRPQRVPNTVNVNDQGTTNTVSPSSLNAGRVKDRVRDVRREDVQDVDSHSVAARAATRPDHLQAADLLELRDQGLMPAGIDLGRWRARALADTARLLELLFGLQRAAGESWPLVIGRDWAAQHIGHEGRRVSLALKQLCAEGYLTMRAPMPGYRARRYVLGPRARVLDDAARTEVLEPGAIPVEAENR